MIDRDIHGEIAKFLSKVAIEPEDVGAWIYSLTVDKQDLAVVATEWIEANSDRVNSWTSE